MSYFGISADILVNRLKKQTDNPDVRYLVDINTAIKNYGHGLVDELRYTAVVVDIETTGLEVHDEITALSYLKFSFNEELQNISIIEERTLYNEPSFSIPQRIVDLVGITDEMIKGHKIVEEDFVNIFDGVEFIVAHNAWFDANFIRKFYEPVASIPWLCTFEYLDKDKHGLGRNLLHV